MRLQPARKTYKGMQIHDFIPSPTAKDCCTYCAGSAKHEIHSMPKCTNCWDSGVIVVSHLKTHACPECPAGQEMKEFLD